MFNPFCGLIGWEGWIASVIAKAPPLQWDLRTEVTQDQLRGDAGVPAL
jgi:hypothetical protein